MRGLTLIRPWDEPVVGRPPGQVPIDAAKPVENRGWPVPRKHLGATIAIHAGKRYSEDGRRFCERVGFRLLTVRDSEEHRAGRVVGTVRIVGCVHRRIGDGVAIESVTPGAACEVRAAARSVFPGAGGQRERSWNLSVWFFGPYGWLFDSALPIPRPVPCRGYQGLWTLPDDVAREVSAQVEEVRCAG